MLPNIIFGKLTLVSTDSLCLGMGFSWNASPARSLVRLKLSPVSTVLDMEVSEGY